MYLDYFGLSEKPFSIAPDPTYLYMSARHREAMAHLSYGLTQGGGFIVLTGEVGTGKTTLCRNLLNDLPDNMDVALILNPNIDESELLQTVCDELEIVYPADASQKKLLDTLNRYLLDAYADNRQTVLIIDEAQLLSRDVLEQIRLLTNLETTKSKLLQIVLIGQPELSEVLARNDLRQLAQRVTARYHLGALQADEIEDYVNFRLGVAGCRQPLFSRPALKLLHKASDGIPRKINVLADHALLGTYVANKTSVDSAQIKTAASEMFGPAARQQGRSLINKWGWLSIAAATLVLLNVTLWWWFTGESRNDNNTPDANSLVTQPQAVSPQPLTQVTAEPAASESQTESGRIQETNTANPSPVNPNPNDSDLTTIIKSDDIAPGSVVISDEYLDADPIVPSQPPVQADVQAPRPRLSYDPDSAFGRLLAGSADKTGRMVAFRNLAAAWDVELPTPLIAPACEALLDNGVACLSVENWLQLERFNRPSILVLEHGDQLHRVIVFRLQDGLAQVLVGDEVQEVNIDELKARWTSNGITFWRPSAVGTRFLQPADVGEQIPLVRSRLNTIFAQLNMPLLENENLTVFDSDMAQKILTLQSVFGIASDSKIGNETYLLMNELLEPELTPVLRARQKSS